MLIIFFLFSTALELTDKNTESSLRYSQSVVYFYLFEVIYRLFGVRKWLLPLIKPVRGGSEALRSGSEPLFWGSFRGYTPQTNLL